MQALLDKGLTSTELALLSALDRQRTTRVTVAQAKDLVGPGAGDLLASLARKRVLDRIGRGVYLARPLRAIGRPWSISALAAVELTLRDEPHYIGGLAALTIHRLSDQLNSSLVDVFVVRRRRKRTVANANVRFHSIRDSEIGIGVSTVAIERVNVRVSNPEKTVLDALNHSSAFGGSAQGLRIADRALDKVDVATLVTYALQLSPTSTIQRLGVLMQRRDADDEQQARLADAIRGTRNLPAMIPGPRRGRFNATWRIFENDA
jgi:predicted transcriptional regulator of viral defense system